MAHFSNMLNAIGSRAAKALIFFFGYLQTVQEFQHPSQDCKGRYDVSILFCADLVTNNNTTTFFKPDGAQTK